MKGACYELVLKHIPDNQHVRLLVSARAYQLANNVFLSQQTSTSRAYQPRNQQANRLYDVINISFGEKNGLVLLYLELR